jgi:flagellar FliJ protein
MKAFQFRLEKVRQIRETQRRQSQAGFLRARRLLSEQLKRLAALDDKRQQAALVYADAAQGRFTVGCVAAARRYLTATEHNVARQGKNVATAEEHLEETRVDLMEKTKDKKVLDRLHDKRLAEYQVEAQREKQKQIDETARQKYLSKREARVDRSR